MRLQAPWVNRLAEGLRVEDIATTRRVMAVVRGKLEEDGEASS